MLPPNTRAWHLKIKLVDLVGGLFKTFIVYLQPIRKAVSELQIIYIYIYATSYSVLLVPCPTI
jgi:hypothetical protein